MEHLTGMVAIGMFFGIPLLVIWTRHQRRMLELKLMQGNTVDSSVQAELQALRQEVRSLRDTTMQYDLSFDTALQNMERKQEGMDRKIQNLQHDSISELVGRR